VIQIRKAIVADIPALVAFQMSLALESENVILDQGILATGLKALFDDPTKGYYNIAEDDGEPVGCHMVTYEWSDWRNGMVLWLQSVYVREAYRKKGVFRQMYDNLADAIRKDPGLRGLRLYVDKSNERAMKTYEKMGMDGSHYTVYEWMKS
jgi:ribosomal protein S18 acetylase RimI-like enzyme